MSSVRRIAATAALTIAAGLGGIGTAQASPTPEAGASATAPTSFPDNCTYGELRPQYDPPGATAVCRTGTGAYQVIVNCKSRVTGDTDFYYGKWVYKGTQSIRICPPMNVLRYVGINLRGY